MAITVNIIIKGIALCYRKPQPTGTGTRWRVLFPFDDDGCHRLNYTSRKGDEPVSGQIPLADPKRDITITADGITPADDSNRSERFKDHVLNLTSAVEERKTHTKIRTLGSADQWKKRTVFLKIDAPADFSVDSYLDDPSGVRPILYEFDKVDPTPNSEIPKDAQLPGWLAQTVKATIKVPDGGSNKVTLSTRGLTETFTDPGEYTLTFDNDCEGKKTGRNDMEMLYEKTIVDFDDPKKRFLVGKRPKRLTSSLGLSSQDETLTNHIDKFFAKFSIPASLAEGKPCLAVWVEDASDLP